MYMYVYICTSRLDRVPRQPQGPLSQLVCYSTYAIYEYLNH